ncbi:MAG TPA: hypothetical protein VIT67_07655 [Povalibacter sp.]
MTSRSESGAKLGTSKFKSTPGYGEGPRGLIILVQDHGDDVALPQHPDPHSVTR